SSSRRPDALGEKPAEGREIRAWYLRDGGAEGNVAAGTLDTLKDPIPHLKVTNPAAATGGRAAETLANAMPRGPQELPALQRPVRAKAKVVVHREEDPKAVERRLMTRLNQIINPLRTPVRPSGWPFGEPLRAFHVYETVRAEPGVSYVEDIQFVVDDVPDQNL